MPDITIEGPDGVSAEPGVPVGGGPREPTPRARRWTALLIGALLIFGLGIVVGTHLHDDRSASGVQSPDSTTAPMSSSHLSTPQTADGGQSAFTPMSDRASLTSPAPAVPATDFLLPGNGYGANIDDTGRVTITLRLVNGSDQTLALADHAGLQGPDGALIPRSSSEIYPGWDYQAGVAPSSLPLLSIAPRQQVTLLVDVTVDCSPDSPQRRWPAQYPTVVIPLTGFSHAWTRPFNKIFSNDPEKSLYARACESQSTESSPVTVSDKPEPTP